MEISIFNKNENYGDLVSLWEQRSDVIMPKEFLSDYGVMCKDGDTIIAIMWLYPVVSCNWAMIRFPISNSEVSNETRDLGLNLVFNTIHNIAKDMGYTQLFCSTNHSGLSKRLEKYGYSLEHTDCSHYWVGV